MKPTWSVTTLTRNTRYDFCRYVAWYLEQGAECLHLYFHDPEDPNIALVENNDRVDVTRLTPDLLAELAIVQNNHGLMQANIGTHSYRRSRTDWMLRCDIDELIFRADGRSLADLLAELDPKEVDTIRIDMAEYLRGGGTATTLRFRTEIADRDLEKVYGDVGPLLASRFGFLGHRRGKSISRCGQDDLLMQIHVSRYTDRAKRPRELVGKMLAPIRLLHFNSGTLEQWMDSLHYRLDFSSFDSVLAQRLRDLLAEGEAGNAEIARIYKVINEFDESRFQALAALGHGFVMKMDFDALIAKHFPGVDI